MKIIITENQLKTLMESIEPSSVKGSLIKLGIPNSVIDSFGSPMEGSWVVRVKTNNPWPMDTLSISYPALDDELTNPDVTKVRVKIGKKEFNTTLDDATKQVSSKYKELKVLSEMDYRNLDDVIKFGEFSEHFKKEDLKKINKFLLLIRKLGVVNMLQAGDFFLMSIQYFKDFMKMKSYERDFDEDIVSEIEEMIPHISSIMINAGMSLVEKNNTEVTPKSVERAIKILVSSIMKYYMTQNLPNVNESYDKEKNFLKDNFGFDFSGKIKQITSSYDVPWVFDSCLSPASITLYLNRLGPIYLFELDGTKYLYQDRGEFEWFMSDNCNEYVENEIPEKLGIAEMGFSFSDILNMYFEEGED
jgi:hypothetical protein